MSDKRRQMPNRRNSVIQSFRVEGRKVHFTAGLYEDGTVGEIFMVISKTGSNERVYLDSLVRIISLAVQSGVPLTEVVEMIRGTKCRPCGIVEGHEHIKFCESPLDLLAKWLEIDIL